MSDEYFESTPDTGLAVGTAAPVWELSGWWRRVGAQVIDYFVVYIPITVLIAILGVGGEAAADDTSFSANVDFVGMFAYLIFSSVYYMWTMSSWDGQTVGKRVTGIRVVREDGQAVDAKYAFTRQTLVIGLLFGWLAALLLFLPTILNYLWPLWDEKHQALHDKIVKSRVVRAYAVNEVGPIQAAQQQAPFPIGTTPRAPVPAPGSIAPPTAPPAPPAPGGTSTPYTPPPGFDNPVPEDDR